MGAHSVLDAVGEISHPAHSPIRAKADVRVAADPRQATYIQVSEFTVRGAQAGKPLADLSIPESYRWVPPAVPAGLPFNVAQLYMRMAEGIREGKSVSPDFDVAVKRHQLLDVIQKASDTGIRQIL